MNHILTANVANNLYWLGRHLERVEATLLEINKIYDLIIDVDFDAGKEFYTKIGLNIEYKNASDFLQKSILGTHEGNLNQILSYAKENAVISRSYIELEAFGSIIQLAMLFEEKSKEDFTVDFIFIDEVLSLISEIWGELTRKLKRNVNDYFLILGKNVEKVDFHLRLGKNKDYAMVIMEEVDTIVSILAPEATFTPHDASEPASVILESMNNKIHKIIEF
ncbi:alpha-E domain-containing protein [Sulfurimonas sp.]|uniref:alpha-E domain-containing protein n=1 Tax=Sulfurimonas sp. TaxID=2022749 RepID=UPI003D0AF48F